MSDLLNKLRAWIDVIQKAVIYVAIFETILVIVIGIASSNIFIGHWWVLVCSAIIYIVLKVLLILYQKNFPGSIVDELEAKGKLEENTKLFERQKAINQFLSDSISELNNETCNITDDAESELCNKGLVEGLKALIDPIVSYTNVILNTSTEKQFTIGAHFTDIYLSRDIKSRENNIIIILKDELKLGDIVFKNLMQDEEASGASFEIKTAIDRSLNNKSYFTSEFNYNKNNYSIICAEIYQVCSNCDLTGVLFIISRKGIEYPNDTSEVLAIFNRLIANYISKYNECIHLKDKI